MTKNELQHAWEVARDEANKKIRFAMQLGRDATAAQEDSVLAQNEEKTARAALLAPRDPDARTYVIEITVRVDCGGVLVETRREGAPIVRLRRLYDSVALADDYARALKEGLTDGRENVTVTKVYL